MSFPSTNVKSFEQDGKKFKLYILEFENAVFSFFFEGESRKVGTMAIATPKTVFTGGSSSILLGYRNANIARLLAEHFAVKLEKMAISSIFIYSEDDVYINRILLKLAQEASVRR